MTLPLDRIISEHIAPHASAVDVEGEYPRRALAALGEAGLLGLISSPDVGGKGETVAAAAEVVEKIAAACGSTAMVVCMHYCGTAVIEKYGPVDVRRDIALGKHVTTLAFSEQGSRSHFWAPLGTAKRDNGSITLEARKSWITSAGEADSYVWSSRPIAGDGASTLWLVPAKAPGLSIAAPFDGLGLRGNASTAVEAKSAAISNDAMLGEDGKGFDAMMGIVLPTFSILSASVSLGLMEGALAAAIKHVTGTSFQHLSQTLADLPTIRSQVAKARIKIDCVKTLRDDTLVALSGNRADTMLRVLEVKAAAGDAALEVTDIAMRVCGGAAFRKEAGVERYFRDSRAAAVMGPTSDVLYEFLGKAVCGLPLF